MAFVNISLLLGGLFAAIPIVLHLLMRRAPRQQVFPAFEFLIAGREANRRRLQIRHWLLLLLRCMLIGLLALALARPSVESSQFGGGWILVAGGGLWMLVAVGLVLAVVQRLGRWLIAGLAACCLVLGFGLALQAASLLGRGGGIMIADQRAPICAVLVVDNSPRMLLRHQNRTRLEEAREMGRWLLKQFPEGSQLAVLGARPDPAVFAVDLASAESSLERIQATPAAQPLPDAVERALHLAATSTVDRREIYVLTDLTAAAWPLDAAARVRSQLEMSPGTPLYVIDVGVADPRNFALGDLLLSAESVPSGTRVSVETELVRFGPATTQAVDLFLEQHDSQRPVLVDGRTLLPEVQRRDQASLEVAENGRARLDFQLGRLAPGVHQGYVEIRGADGLRIDDIRYFTLQVREPSQVLVTAPADVTDEFLVEALAPADLRRAGEARFACVVIEQAELADRDLDAFGAVCLLDPHPLSAQLWNKLARYVRSGGGVAFFLGHNAHPPAVFGRTALPALLGGQLVRQWRSGGRDLFLAPARYDHPILAPFRAQATSVPWSQAPVFRHWVLEDLPETTNVVVRLSNNRPAMLETAYGSGRVLTMTTPVSDSLAPPGRRPWNELPTSPNAWPFVVLVNEALAYLADRHTGRLNYLAGEAAVLDNDAALHPDRYQLFPPDGAPREVLARQNEITVRFTEQLGLYHLKGFRGGPLLRGFAVNLPYHATALDRHDPASLAAALGDTRVHYAASRDEIEIEVGQARAGREFYPLLIVLLVFAVGLEQLFSNRFYREAS